MKLLYSYMRRLCAYITDRLYQFKRFLQLSIDGLGLSCPVFTKVTGILPVALVCFQFVCLAQESPAGREATEKGEVEFRFPPKPVYNYTLYDAVWGVPMLVQRYYDKAMREFPKTDLYKFPMEMHRIDEDKIPWIKQEDIIPKEIMDLPLWVVNDEFGRDTITLRTESEKEWLVLYTWFTACAPCVRTMQEYEEIVKSDGQKFNLVGINSSHTPHYAMPSARRFGFTGPQVIGPIVSVLSNTFFKGDNPVGCTILIKDDRLFGIANPKLTKEEFKMIITGELSDIPDHARWSFNQ